MSETGDEWKTANANVVLEDLRDADSGQQGAPEISAVIRSGVSRTSHLLRERHRRWELGDPPPSGAATKVAAGHPVTARMQCEVTLGAYRERAAGELMRIGRSVHTPPYLVLDRDAYPAVHAEFPPVGPVLTSR